MLRERSKALKRSYLLETHPCTICSRFKAIKGILGHIKSWLGIKDWIRQIKVVIKDLNLVLERRFKFFFFHEEFLGEFMEGYNIT